MNKYLKLIVFVMLAAFLVMPLGASASHNSDKDKDKKECIIDNPQAGGKSVSSKDHKGKDDKKCKPNKCYKALKYLEKSENAKNEKYAQKYYEKYLKYSKYCDLKGDDKCEKALKYLAKSEAASKPKYVEKYYQKYMKYSKYCDDSEPENTPPVANNHQYPAVEIDKSFTGNLLDLPATDAEDDNVELQRVIVSQPNVGTLTLNSDGTFTYNAPSSSDPDATFTFKVVDSDGAESNVATVTIPISDPPNNAPVAEHFTFPAITVGNNFSGDLYNLPFSDTEDTDKRTLTVVIVSQPNVGTITVNGDGTFNYVAPGEEEPDGFFTYKVIDSKGAESNVAKVTIPIIFNDDF